jgi:hypothetical protein
LSVKIISPSPGIMCLSTVTRDVHACLWCYSQEHRKICVTARNKASITELAHMKFLLVVCSDSQIWKYTIAQALLYYKHFEVQPMGKHTSRQRVGLMVHRVSQRNASEALLGGNISPCACVRTHNGGQLVACTFTLLFHVCNVRSHIIHVGAQIENTTCVVARIICGTATRPK